MFADYVTLMADQTTREVFTRVAESRKIQLGDLALSGAMEATLASLEKLKRAELVGEVPGAIPDLSVYYVTSKGLSADRELRRQFSRAARSGSD